MSGNTVAIIPRDPILVRDGRPFSADSGSIAVSMPWPLPSTLAGALRTHIGNMQKVDWQSDGPQKVLQGVSVSGPLPIIRKNSTLKWQLYLPAPLDAVTIDDNEKLVRLSPMQKYPRGAGCDMPKGLMPLAITEDGKPLSGRNYWSLNETTQWLAGGNAGKLSDYIGNVPSEIRVNVKIDPQSYSSEEGMLFSVSYLSFNDVDIMDKPQLAMAAKISGALTRDVLPESYLTFGGERRVAAISQLPTDIFKMPDSCKDSWKKVKETGRLRIQLAAPALFSKGWMPEWLNDENGILTGISPWCGNVQLKLVSAAVGNYIPVSGWGMDTSTKKKQWIKPARFMVPAGSVYFFEIIEGVIDEQLWENLWLKSICDLDSDNNDGFGLAMPGTWEYAI